MFCLAYSAAEKAFIPAVAPLKPVTSTKNLGFLALKPISLSNTKETLLNVALMELLREFISFSTSKNLMNLVSAKIWTSQNYQYMFEVCFYLIHTRAQEDHKPICKGIFKM